MKCLTGIAIPDVFECGDRAMKVLFKQIPPNSGSNVNLALIASLHGMKIVRNSALPKNEIHMVSYRAKAGQTVRTLHKIFNLEVS